MDSESILPVITLILGTGLGYFSQLLRDRSQHQRERERDQQQHERQRKQIQSQWQREKMFDLLISLNEMDQKVFKYELARIDISSETGEWPSMHSERLSPLVEEFDKHRILCLSLVPLIADRTLADDLQKLVMVKWLTIAAGSEEVAKKLSDAPTENTPELSKRLADYAQAL